VSNFTERLMRKVTIVGKGKTLPVLLLWGKTFKGQYAPFIWMDFRGQRALESVSLHEVALHDSDQVSCDLSRVKVKSLDPKTQKIQSMTFDLNKDDTGFWLHDGDVIEIPERAIYSK
jgi:hypothetical protein